MICLKYFYSILCIVTGKVCDLSFVAQESNATVFLNSASDSKIGMLVNKHLSFLFSTSFSYLSHVNPYELCWISSFYISILFVLISMCFSHFIWVCYFNSVNFSDEVVYRDPFWPFWSCSFCLTAYEASFFLFFLNECSSEN